MRNSPIKRAKREGDEVSSSPSDYPLKKA